MKLLFLDTETTGNGPDDRLCQLAYKCDGYTVLNELFKPPLPIKIGAMAVNHITNEMVEDKLMFKDSLAESALKDILEDGAILVAHNAKFDIEMLNREGINVPTHICTQKVARYVDDGTRYEDHRLQYLRYFYGIIIDAKAHDAMGDVIILEAVFGKLLTEIIFKEKSLNGVQDTIEQAIRIMVEISMNPSLLTVCNFKKHKGELWKSVVKYDRDYLTWLLAQQMQSLVHERDVDLIYTMEHYLEIK